MILQHAESEEVRINIEQNHCAGSNKKSHLLMQKAPFSDRKGGFSGLKSAFSELKCDDSELKGEKVKRRIPNGQM